ncbi:SusC/RagA family TonB-linked outer membrane protein [Pedobacter nototheniae]|uniref:SusC/RagA family TonB-linked outer membrane protein n=1 Tax=Pedobacter nototheniae TaxID=2488994 RepID=UPI00103F6DEA|nr:SusC/RagA family TonB-linked outer membrane protein [Pedobacter nototheniae]
MRKKLLLIFIGTFLLLAHAIAQQITVTGKVSSEDGPVPGVSIRVKGSTVVSQTNGEGVYSIKALKTDVLTFSYIGYITQERAVGANTSINITLKSEAKGLDEVVITALGNTVKKKELGTSQQTVSGAVIAETQRENFINALQGRVAGVEVTSSSGVPGASSSITIRGVSSISGSNQPLMIVDGLPIDNKTLSTAAFVSDASSNTAFSNRGVDFTNRSADINPEDIESLVVLKGPEAAALYGIDAANGAIVITTKRAKAGAGAVNYSNSFRVETTRNYPELQKQYGIGTSGSGNVITTLNGAYEYFGPEYAAGTQLYDNVKDFFQTGFTQKHNLSFEGGSEKLNYRISTGYTDQQGVVPNSAYQRINLTGASQGIINKWLKTDLSMNYSYSVNDQPLKGSIGPLLGLLVWPQTDDAKNYLTPSGTRKVLSLGTIGNAEIDNPYFNINKNVINSKTNRIISNLGLTITPFSWVDIKTNIGVDSYTNQNLIVRHPESAAAFSRGGTIDVANDVTRNINLQNLINFKKQKLTNDISFDGTLGNSLQNLKSNVDAGYGENFLDPNFYSLNNVGTKLVRTTITQRRLVSFFGRATFDYKNYLFLTGTIRNDRTSTIPKDRYSFWYPSVQGSFVFTDVPEFKSLKNVFTYGKLRAAYANVGKDARPYAYVPTLENKTTTNGGYGYGFTGPNPGLKPEFAKSYEFGTELAFFNNRLGLDVTVYRKETTDQIVNDIRGSYATGFILLNLNGGSTRNQGIELTLRGTPVKTKDFTWDVLANFESAKGTVLSLPNSLPESYVSDTWLYGNVRNGNTPGYSTRSLTGLFYLRNNQGQLLINPTTGVPVRSTTFIDAGYDRQPDFTIGLTNTFTYKNMSLSFLLDIRKGGDVLNATQHFLTTLGLSTNTLDRMTPRIIPGVLQDGKENSSNPTANNIAFIPYYQNGYYTNASEELFIEKNINWIRLRDVTFSYRLPQTMLKKQNFVKSASVFVTGTDLFLITNYTGLDPVVNGNTAAVGGSGASGIDYGNFPMPIGLNFGIKIGL